MWSFIVKCSFICFVFYLYYIASYTYCKFKKRHFEVRSYILTLRHYQVRPYCVIFVIYIIFLCFPSQNWKLGHNVLLLWLTSQKWKLGPYCIIFVISVTGLKELKIWVKFSKFEKQDGLQYTTKCITFFLDIYIFISDLYSISRSLLYILETEPVIFCGRC